METITELFPEDVQTLRALAQQWKNERDAARDERDQAHRTILAYDAVIQEHDARLQSRQATIDALLQQIAVLKRWQFGRRAEALDPAQRALFEETLHEDHSALAQVLDPAEEITEVPTSTASSSPRRAALPDHLPRVNDMHDVPACACGACGGALTRIGEDVHEQLDCEPIHFFVRRHVYPKYACRACDTVIAAPTVAHVIDRSPAAPGLLAHVLVSKYADHLPLYRQAQMAARQGVDMPRSTLADWVGRCGAALDPLVQAMRADLKHDPILHADETPVTYLDPKAGGSRRAYLFAYRTATVQSPIVVFDFNASRSGEHARRFLQHWRGALMVDDYAGYKTLFTHGITELACWAHARRKFYELHVSGQSSHAEHALGFIQRLYREETHAKGLDPPARTRWRQHHSLPILQAFKAWLDAMRPKVAHGTGLARAMDYTIKRWPALIRYVNDGAIPIDNNPIENAIRPIALGRKNWLFAGSLTAGQRAANLMSLIATAKANGHDPYAYLKDVLTRLPSTLQRNIHTLLPQRWQPIA